MVFLGTVNPPGATVARLALYGHQPDAPSSARNRISSSTIADAISSWFHPSPPRVRGESPGPTQLPVRKRPCRWIAFTSPPERDTAATINAALKSGKNLLLTPGIYHLESSIQISRPDTVVLGLGFPTLIPDNGTAALTIADIDGVKVGGILFKAGTSNSPTLFQIGEPAPPHPTRRIRHLCTTYFTGSGRSAGDCHLHGHDQFP